jgi:two-component system alkaline phosphatase synthesis response regulator PhoP
MQSFRGEPWMIGEVGERGGTIDFHKEIFEVTPSSRRPCLQEAEFSNSPRGVEFDERPDGMGGTTANPSRDLARTSMRKSVLLVDDEEALRMALSDRLRRMGYAVDSAADGESAFSKATSLPFDLVILDVMLPDRDGIDLCRDIRLAGIGTPILLLTARGETVDKVVGLKLGADDYMTKPFDMQELMARIEVLMRRTPTRTAYQFGQVRVDVRAMQVTRNGIPVHLSARAFQLLCYFVEHPGITLTREKILQDVWDYDAATSATTRTVDMHVAVLRQKLETDPRRPELIITVPGSGYKFAK